MHPSDGVVYRWRRQAALVMAGLVVSVLLVFVPTAGAGVSDDPDHWAYDAGQFIRNECVDVPSSLMGSASGVVAPLGLTQRGMQAHTAPGSMGGPPTTVPDPRGKAGSWNDEWYRQKLKNDDLVRLKNLPANNSAASPSQQVKLPISTVGGSGSAVIETTGTVKTGTDNSKAVVSPARVAGTGVSAITGSSVALSALTFGGALCGSLNALGAVFGDPWAPGVTAGASLVTGGYFRPCAESGFVPGAHPTDYCQTFASSAGVAMRFTRVVVDPGSGAYQVFFADVSIRHTDGTISGSAAARPTAVVPCLEPANRCGMPPFEVVGVLETGKTPAGVHVGSSYDGDLVLPGIGWNSSFPTRLANGVLNVDDELFSRGYLRRLSATVSCKRPDDMHVLARQEYSALFYDDDPSQQWPDASCPTGYAPISVLLKRQTRIGGGSTAATWGAPESTALDWALPPSVVANAPALRCFMVGATTCPRTDLSPGNPAGNESIGGPGGVSVPKSTPSVRVVVDEVVDSMDLPEDTTDWETRTDPDADPDPDPGGGGPPTTTPRDETVPDFEPPPPAPAPPGGPTGGAGYGACLEERLADADDGVTWNPVTWVRTLLWWVAAPIICAVWWLFVPPDGWESLLTAMRDLWDESPALAPFRAFSSSLTINTSGCAPVNLPDAFGTVTPTIDVALCDTAAVAIMWSVAIALGVMAVAKEAVRTFSQFSRYREEWSGEK